MAQPTMSYFAISLVIPCFNQGGTLARAVQSAVGQCWLHEILIVDDHSTDSSLEAAKQLAAENDQVRVLQTDCNIGGGGARNAGARAASGSHLCFLDADDELLSDFFGAVHELIAAHPDMQVVKPEEEFFDPVKGYILPTFDPRHRSAVISSVHGLVLERNLFMKIGGFPEDPRFRGPFAGEDVAFMQALMTHCQPVGRIEQPGYRVWSMAGTHLDRFLANTRLTETGFEFVKLHPDQEPGGCLAQALEQYLAQVARVFDTA